MAYKEYFFALNLPCKKFSSQRKKKLLLSQFTNGSGNKIPACYLNYTKKVKLKYQHVFHTNTRCDRIFEDRAQDK